MVIAIILVTLIIALCIKVEEAGGKGESSRIQIKSNQLFAHILEPEKSIPQIKFEVAGFYFCDEGDIVCLARQMTIDKFGEGEWPAMDELIRRESNYNVYATNCHSGAYGIPQSLPPHKMASEGDDWRDNPKTQLKWMLAYIETRFGSPTDALNFHSRNNWY